APRRDPRAPELLDLSKGFPRSACLDRKTASRKEHLLRIRSRTALIVALVVLLSGTDAAAATACPGGGAGGTRVNVLSAAASYLGVTVDQLKTDLKSGKTLAQLVAATTGKTLAGLKAAIQAAAKTQLDQAVAAGTITSAQEQTALD